MVARGRRLGLIDSYEVAANASGLGSSKRNYDDLTGGVAFLNRLISSVIFEAPVFE